MISGNAPVQQKIATAHMIFNIAGVLLFIPFVPMIEKVLNKWLPQKNISEKKLMPAEP